eukprot:603238-Rhodomonas_salina.1
MTAHWTSTGRTWDGFYNEDKDKLVKYIDHCLGHGMFCKAGAMITAEVDERRNILLYVTTRALNKKQSSLRTSFNASEANGKDLDTYVKQKLCKNTLDVLKKPLQDIAQFCKDSPEISVNKVLAYMISNDLNMS